MTEATAAALRRRGAGRYRHLAAHSAVSVFHVASPTGSRPVPPPTCELLTADAAAALRTLT